MKMLIFLENYLIVPAEYLCGSTNNTGNLLNFN